MPRRPKPKKGWISRLPRVKASGRVSTPAGSASGSVSK
jgi:hypothetical protein